MRKDAPKLYMEARQGSETTMYHLVLDGTQLRYTYNFRTDIPPGAPRMSISQNAHYAEKDLKTKQASLTPVEAQKLESQVRKSDFFRLKSDYGDLRGRSYSYPLTIGLDGARKTVTFHSGLHGGPCPRAHRELTDALLALARRKFPEFRP